MNNLITKVIFIKSIAEVQTIYSLSDTRKRYFAPWLLLFLLILRRSFKKYT